MSQHPAPDVEALTSRAAPPALDVAVAHPEQELCRAGAPPSHFDEAQTKQALWQEFRDHDASINNTLTEALQVHEGPSWQIFQVSVLRRIRDSFPHLLCVRAFSDSVLARVLNWW
jgi:hypothetical protein